MKRIQNRAALSIFLSSYTKIHILSPACYSPPTIRHSCNWYGFCVICCYCCCRAVDATVYIAIAYTRQHDNRQTLFMFTMCMKHSHQSCVECDCGKTLFGRAFILNKNQNRTKSKQTEFSLRVHQLNVVLRPSCFTCFHRVFAYQNKKKIYKNSSEKVNKICEEREKKIIN